MEYMYMYHSAWVFEMYRHSVQIYVYVPCIVRGCLSMKCTATVYKPYVH